ncbi:MAG: hypothetical protein NTY08_14345 [Proteobacteria bacterium]|nr:hypothetical protein [Pseudomonadota bacterium]
MRKKTIQILFLGSALLVGAGASVGSAADTENAPSSHDWACPAMGNGQMMGAHGAQWLRELKRETIEGRIEDVHVQEACMGEHHGLHLKVRRGDTTYNVHLGPTSVVDDRKFRFALGDDIRVNGAFYEANGEKFIVAFTVEKGQQKLILRDEDGRPTWTAARGRMQGRRVKSAPAH